MTGKPTQFANAGEALQAAMRAAQGGDLARARSTAEAALESGLEPAAQFHAFLGMVLARTGELDGSAEHLFRAHEINSDDITIAVNLVAVLMEQGRDEEALKVASRLSARDESMRLARYHGFLAQKLERFEEAAAAYQRVLTRFPEDFECWNNLGNAHVGTGNNEAAVEALERAIQLDPRAGPTRVNLATALVGLERESEAEEVLLRACADFPNDTQPPYQLYVLYKSQLRQDDALEQLERAAGLDPAAADMQLKLAIEYGVARRTDDAERAYRRVIELDPTQLDAYIGLAIQYEHTNREDMFAPLIEQAKSNGIDENSLALIQALELRRTKQFEEALSRLEDAPESLEVIRTTHIRATLLDRLGRTDEAFAAFTEANKLFEETPTAAIERAAELRAKVAREIAVLDADWRDSWQDVTVDHARADPTFLVGFPRSGTTLLDTMLMGHASTLVLEEQPPLNIVEEAVGGLSALTELGSAEILEARDRYFEEVEKIASLPTGAMLVDKSPLFLYRLPLIHRLFPKAKIILALRHPCDVVLSCFMSNFRLNSAMSNFLRLEDAAEFYDLAFTHWTRSRRLSPADIYTVTYEKLVEDVRGEVEPLVEWLGLDWDESLLDHTATAKSRGLISTASYSQVTEPIYRRASGRWLRYREHLDPVLDKLRPWCEEFGYGNPRDE